ncbi:MAG: CpsD/CapB family tyrosine-protein kinase [Desulfobaccales bacterium]
MSFITKAIAKAKAARPPKVQPASSPRSTPFQEPEVEVTTGFVETPGEIHYTHTRTVAVDMEKLRRQRLMVAGSDESLGEAYKLLRTQVLSRTKPEGRNTLMVTGPLPNEGKTLTSINLAIAISKKIGQTVLLVDGDLRIPSIHRCLDLPAGPGLVDYLTSGYPIADSLVHPEGLANLVVLPAGNITRQSHELLSSPVMVDLVRELKHFYPDRYVLFDLPPLVYADPLAFAPLMDGIILVAAAGSTPKEEITRSLAMLKEFPVLGFVLNKVDSTVSSRYYYEKYYPERDSERKFKLPWRK